MKASAKMMQLTIYEAAKIQLAGLAWWQAKKHTCFKHCPAAKAYVLVARPRRKVEGQPISWPVIFYLDGERVGFVPAASLPGAQAIGDAWITEQLEAAIARRRGRQEKHT